MPLGSHLSHPHGEFARVMPVCLSIDLPEDAQVHSARPCILEEASSTTSLEIEKFPMVDLELEDLEMAARAQYSMKASVDGYPAVADCIIRDPDDELFVFRKFRWLSARKLLHLESELMVLEQELRGLDQEALVSSKISLQKSRRNWEQFAKNALETSGQSGDKKRMEVMEKIDVKLERYRKPNLISLGSSRNSHSVLLANFTRDTDHALQLQGNILKFESPSKRVLTALRNDFFGLPGNKCLLAGTAELMFEDSEDLAVLKGPTDKDTLSRLLRDHWVFSTTVRESNHCSL